jgi:excinuclease ABC subunit A
VTLEESEGSLEKGTGSGCTRPVPVPFSGAAGGGKGRSGEKGERHRPGTAGACPLSHQTEVPCPVCGGARLRPEALAVTLGGRSIFEVSTIPTGEAIGFFETLTFEPALERVGPPLVSEIVKRLGFLGRVGLNYLTLDRGAATLSGGELQRVRLAAQIGSGLVGVCYVLDEPTSGLHPRDTERLLECLKALCDAGNTVLVVEHDESVIRAADWVVDLGPGAGPDGGRLLVEGTPATLDETAGSVTARFLQAVPKTPNGATERLSRSPSALEIVGASEHNLRAVDARFPIGCITCVTGVSGSGKSTLAQDILARAARRHLGFGGPLPGAHASLSGLDAIQTFVDIDQTPIGRSPRSTPATFVGVFDEIRALFARTREAKIRGYKSARFSFNAKGGRCETCLGLGARKIEMQFLADLFVPCDACRGLRYNRPTLEVRFRGLSIGEVLQLRVDAALALFDAIPKVRRGLSALHQAGLGYVTLGQSSTTLSGGESQRVKLAAGLNRMESSGALYVLDEPTTGLHAADVANLLVVLTGLADRGSTLVVIEHNLDVIRSADWVIDLGPGGGPDGGRVVANGTPAEVANAPNSVTGRYL